MGDTRRIRRTTVAALVAALLLATLAGCGRGGGGGGGTGADGGGPEPQPGGTLVFGVEAATTGGWNPTTSRFAISGHTVASAIYDPLMIIDDDGTPQPFLAETVQPNLDFTEWRIRLQDGIRFHDGTPLTAEAVKAGLDAHRQSALTGAVLDYVSDVQVDDELTVVVTMAEPWATFPYLLAANVGYVFAPSMLTDTDGEQAPIGTGPFQMQEWTPGGERVSVVRNEDYWREGRPYLDGIEFEVIPDPTERAEALRNGDVDLIHTVRDEDILQFRSDSEVTMIEDDSGEENFAMLNTEVAPFDDPLVRQALAMATDQSRLVDVLGSGIVREATSLFPEGLPWHPDDPQYPAFDPDQAAQMVAQHEELTGEPVAFTFDTTPTTDNLAAAQLLESMWEDVGMDVEIATFEQSELIEHAIGGDFQAVNWRLFGSPDPDGEFVWLHSSHSEPVGEISLNFSRMENPVVDAALEAGRATDDPEVRERSYQTLAQEVNGALPFVWLQQTLWALVARSSVEGLDSAADGGIGALGAKPWLADLWIPA
jgi:peptide/nickel transport system substrate-binding protein